MTQKNNLAPAPPYPGDDVFVVTGDTVLTLQHGVVTHRQGPYVLVRSPDDSLGKKFAGHRSQVLPKALLGELAVSPLSQQTDPIQAHEMALRVQGAAMANYLESRSPEDFGVKPEEQLVEANIWKVNRFLRTDATYESASRELDLARVTKDIEMLPPDQAHAIKDNIYQTNRAALDALYDRYKVDFVKAGAFEIEHDGFMERHITYPSSAGNFYFDEITHWKPGATQPYYIAANVVAGAANEFTAEQPQSKFQ